jgi:hypothetical protein
MTPASRQGKCDSVASRSSADLASTPDGELD